MKMTASVTAAIALLAVFLWTGMAVAQPPPEVSLNNCQNAVKTATKAFVTNKVTAIGICLQAVSTQIVKNNAPDAHLAAGTCLTQFRRLNDSRGLNKQLSDKLAAAIIKKCDPSYQTHSGSFPNTHTLADIIGSGAGVPQPLDAENLNAWCSHYGGDGSIDSLPEWISCITAAAECDVDSAIASQYPRAIEWLNLVKPSMQALLAPATDPTKITDAVAGLAAVKTELDGPDNDNIVSIQCGGIVPTGTAAAGDVLTGKTFSNSSGGGLTGTMPNNGAVTLTPTTTDQTIAAGYHNGAGKCAGDVDLVSGNIKSGVNLFGIDGSYLCQAGLTNCGGTCTNTQSDTANCGTCATICPAGNVCSAGTCALSCQAGLTKCGSTCTNTQRDSANCGNCGVACPLAETCVASACGCPGSLTACNNACTNTMNDPANCGTCSHACDSTQVCSGGACGCSSGLTSCGSGATCANTSTDPNNCGACGTKCTASEQCTGGNCVVRDFGTGADGALTLAGTATINTVASAATANSGTNTVLLSTTPGTPWFTAGEIVLIHQTQGAVSGQWEFAQIASVAGNNASLTLTHTLVNSYSSSGGSHAQVFVVPQFSNVTINAAANLNAPAWNGSTGGILAFKASGTTNIAGTVTMASLGYRGGAMNPACGTHCSFGYSGESPLGAGVAQSQSSNGSGGAGGARGQDCGMGGGGAYGTVGGTGIDNATGACAAGVNAPGGAVAGSPNLGISLLLGGGGGSAGTDDDGGFPGSGGAGGGAVIIMSSTFTMSSGGSVNVGGGAGGSGNNTTCGSGCGMGGGGGGAGGAVRIVAGTATLGANLITANGASGGVCTCGVANSGAGGAGRIAVKAAAVTGTTNPAFAAN